MNSYSQQADSSIVVQDTMGHSVKKAVVLSAIVPGAGQIYNHIAMPKGKKKAFWKVPLIYAGIGTTSYFLLNNQKIQKELKVEYTNRLDDSYTPTEWANYDDPGILTLYNQHLKFRDLSILALSGVYIIQLIDAGVEAHFVHFDVSEDLTLSFHPVVFNAQTPGISMKLNFR